MVMATMIATSTYDTAGRDELGEANFFMCG
jgi:hypothetical protein